MNKKTLAIIMLVVGIILLLLSLVADIIGIGSSPIFGTNQIIGTIIGVILAVVGFVLYLRG